MLIPCSIYSKVWRFLTWIFLIPFLGILHFFWSLVIQSVLNLFVSNEILGEKKFWVLFDCHTKQSFGKDLKKPRLSLSWRSKLCSPFINFIQMKLIREKHLTINSNIICTEISSSVIEEEILEDYKSFKKASLYNNCSE